MSDDNKWERPDAPPPPLFLGQKEKDLVKQVNDELIERVIGQRIIYYPISLEHTNFHSLYGEAIQKTFLPPVHVHALVKWEGTETTQDVYSIDKRSKLTIGFHKRRLVEDQNLFVREGDFVLFGDLFYEIAKLSQPKLLFGDVFQKLEISAICIRARENVFNAK
jgi:hypothetical protein